MPVLQVFDPPIRRFNLAHNPGAFVEHQAVQQALAARGNDCLSLLVADERVAVEGSYPLRETLAALTGVVVRKLTVGASCCGPSTANVGPGEVRLLLRASGK